jgi:hypothetical protein
MKQGAWSNFSSCARSASHVPDETAQAERSAIESRLMNAQFTKELSFDAAT